MAARTGDRMAAALGLAAPGHDPATTKVSLHTSPAGFPLGPGVANSTPTPRPPAQQAPSKLRTTHIRLGAEADAYLDRLDAAWRAAGYRGHISAAAVIRHALARLDQDAKDDAVVRAAKGSS